MNEQIIKDKTEELENTIDPEMIVMDDDSDMPEPETKVYENAVKCTPKFMHLFNQVVGELPYATILKNTNGEQIKLIDLVKYVEQKHNRILVEEIDKIIAFIANLGFKYARPLMEVIESPEGQRTLWQKVD